MRLFNGFESPKVESMSDSGHRKRVSKKAPRRISPELKDERIIKHAPPSVSRGEVLAKIERAKKKSEVKKSEELPQEAPKEESKVEEKDSKKDHLLKSDIKMNDPKGPEVREKLKDVLRMGAFNFNPKEKEVLSKILNDKS